MRARAASRPPARAATSSMALITLADAYVRGVVHRAGGRASHTTAKATRPRHGRVGVRGVTARVGGTTGSGGGWASSTTEVPIGLDRHGLRDAALRGRETESRRSRSTNPTPATPSRMSCSTELPAAFGPRATTTRCAASSSPRRTRRCSPRGRPRRLRRRRAARRTSTSGSSASRPLQADRRARQADDLRGQRARARRRRSGSRSRATSSSPRRARASGRPRSTSACSRS